MTSSPLSPLASSPPRHNLPAPLTSLVGREGDAAEACALLRQDSIRLVTMTGPGGVGKTRLALKVAGELLDDFEHGVFFVSLASISDPQLVVSRIGQTLDVREFGGQPLLELLKAYLREKQLLLVLDNYEHVLAAASLVSDLLLTCPALKILVTSRALLHLDGEREYGVSPLELPELPADRGTQTESLDPTSLALDQVVSSPAVELFVQRAHAVRRDFGLTGRNERAVGEICIHLDGLPLAIELAAARVKLFEPGAILKRLQGTAEAERRAFLSSPARDVPARQQTLEQTIAWSYDLLGAAHQAVFRRLAVFAGGCTLDAATAVCADLSPEDDRIVTDESIPDALQTLLDFNLLTRASGREGEMRYGMLETIRAFAWQRLRESGEEEMIRRRHTQVFLAFAERAAEELHGPDDFAWLARLETEHDNLRAALRWTLETPGMAGLCLQLAAALEEYWPFAGNMREGQDWLLGALALPGAQVATVTRVKALRAAGNLLRLNGNYDPARQMHEDSVHLARQLGDRRELAYCLARLVTIRGDQWDLGDAHLLSEEATALFREVGDRWGLALVLGEAAYYELYDRDTSIALVEESLALSQALGNRLMFLTSLRTASITYGESGDYVRARSLMEQVVALIRPSGLRRLLAAGLNSLGIHLKCLGEYQEARAHFEEALALARELGNKVLVAAIQGSLGDVWLRQGELDLAASAYQEGISLATEIGWVYSLAANILGIAGVATAIGQEHEAARLLGATEVVLNITGESFGEPERIDHEYIMQTLSVRLDGQALEAARAEGRTLSKDQAVALALEIAEAAQGK